MLRRNAYLSTVVGVSSYDVSLEKQSVLVKGTISYDDVLEKIKKTGKEVRLYFIALTLPV